MDDAMRVQMLQTLGDPESELLHLVQVDRSSLRARAFEVLLKIASLGEARHDARLRRLKTGQHLYDIVVRSHHPVHHCVSKQK